VGGARLLAWLRLVEQTAPLQSTRLFTELLLVHGSMYCSDGENEFKAQSWKYCIIGECLEGRVDLHDHFEKSHLS
jgi:hypothetical protein